MPSALHVAFTHDRYLLTQTQADGARRISIRGSYGAPSLYCEREADEAGAPLRVFADREKESELIWCCPEAPSTAETGFTVLDATSEREVGSLALASNDDGAWTLRGPDGEDLARFRKVSGAGSARGMLEALLLGASYAAHREGRALATYAPRLTLSGRALEIDCSEDPGRELDRRLVVAGAILLALGEMRPTDPAHGAA